MKKFVELIKRVHQERYSVVINRIVAEKIPVAFLSIAPLENAVATVNNLRNQGVNITNLITPSTPPDFQTDFILTPLDRISSIHPRPEYVLTGDFVYKLVDSCFAVKNIPDAKVICLDGGGTEYCYQMFMNHLPELEEVYESLIDDESRRTFRGYWLGRISCQIQEFVYMPSAHYLIEGFIPERGAIVIDGGVFDGGTAKVFAEMGYKVYGFEMDKTNFEIAKKVADEKGFVVENLSLGSHRHEMRYNPSGGSGNRMSSRGSEITQVVTLDAYVRENNIQSVDFIKLDVEGSELDILKGARTSIARYKPILAISAYHKMDDFWVLMNFIKSIRSDYEFAMRQGAETREEEPTNISAEFENYLTALGLDPEQRTCGECVLFAR